MTGQSRSARRIAAALGSTVAVALAVGTWRSQARTRRLRAALRPQRSGPQGRFDSAELDNLPAPVRRYLAHVLQPGQPLIESVRLWQTGTINLDAALGDDWRRFSADQAVTMQPPGFDWDARVAPLSGLRPFGLQVRDAYVAGKSLMRVSAFGVLTLAEAPDTIAMANGELMRFLGETPWYPTALLPGQGVHWSAVDDRSATASLAHSGASVSLRFRFGDDHTVRGVEATARARSVGGRFIDTPWRGSFDAYAQRNGMLVPTRAEAAWLVDGVARPYWRGRVTGLRHTFAAAAAHAAAQPAQR